MSAEWPNAYEKQGTLNITTIGRRSGRRHETTIWFAADENGRLFVSTRDERRDWVRNVLKNPSVEVTIAGVTRKMKAIPLTSDEDKEHLAKLYRKKYLAAKLYSLIAPRYRSPLSFELKSE